MNDENRYREALNSSMRAAKIYKPYGISSRQVSTSLSAANIIDPAAKSIRPYRENSKS